ncbi:glutaredoxin family protein [Catenovulum sp. SM1970]|uniref:glutaredoxin family protein n=1 Tax=Marinifaba aquimaris TaxID=2741323 RepID=UPI001571A8DA|nr:glutaredoxin family protein [Marinifaba aquimaris]NTS77356.1 glutaredoxin family protein [Marinifaba aquimaris]
MNTKAFNLYHTDGCHLCELAESVFSLIGKQALYQHVDIAESEALVDQFGIRIPVVEHIESGACLDWPFDEQALIEFINKNQ